MAVTFPTQAGARAGAHRGEPTRADPCRCGRRCCPCAPEEECVRCGHYPAEVIDRTWQQRANQLASSRVVAASRRLRRRTT